MQPQLQLALELNEHATSFLMYLKKLRLLERIRHRGGSRIGKLEAERSQGCRAEGAGEPAGRGSRPRTEIRETEWLRLRPPERPRTELWGRQRSRAAEVGRGAAVSRNRLRTP